MKPLQLALERLDRQIAALVLAQARLRPPAGVLDVNHARRLASGSFESTVNRGTRLAR
jgi:hypothetical protein